MLLPRRRSLATWYILDRPLTRIARVLMSVSPSSQMTSAKVRSIWRK